MAQNQDKTYTTTLQFTTNQPRTFSYTRINLDE